MEVTSRRVFHSNLFVSFARLGRYYNCCGKLLVDFLMSVFCFLSSLLRIFHFIYGLGKKKKERKKPEGSIHRLISGD